MPVRLLKTNNLLDFQLLVLCSTTYHSKKNLISNMYGGCAVKASKPNKVFLVLLVLSQLLVWPLVAWSQVEEIVVTVSKKSESLQDVPMSVTAFSSADIERKGIKSISDIALLTSSIQFDESFAQSDTRIVVRGLSPSRGRQNIATLVDGVDVSSESITSSGGSLLLNTRLMDVERIEVVLGPQMALYGRSAFNGAIQYITKDASEEFETDIRFDVAENNRYEAVAGVSGPILPTRPSAAIRDTDSR